MRGWRAVRRGIRRQGRPATLGYVSTETSTGPRMDADLVAELTQLVESTSGETFEELSPLTGQVYAQIPVSSPDDIDGAIAVARDFQPRWAEVPLAERAETLLRFHDALLDNQELLLDVVCSESGKARMDAYMELVHLVMTARYYGRRAPELLRTRRGMGGIPVATRIDINHVPKGVIGLITPWNYPLTMGLCDGLAALVAGNTIVHKPDSQTVLTSALALALLRGSGVPAEAWQLVAGSGSKIGPQLVAKTDMICFTGSTATGRKLATATGERLISISAELGGKNAAFVLADADIQAAAEGLARGCFNNAGQLCVHIERIYVSQAIYSQFRDAFAEAVEALRLAPGLGWDAEMGTLISPDQLTKVQAHLADARSKGATVLVGGRPRPDLAPWCHEPTVLEGVTPEMDCHLGETFGPLVSLYPVTSIDEAVRMANLGSQGLNASVWTTDHARGRALARRLRAGTVNINEGYAATISSIDAPMGGMGDSGIGRRQGAEGLLRFTETQSVATQRLIPLAPFGGLDQERFARVLNVGLRMLRRLPRP